MHKILAMILCPKDYAVLRVRCVATMVCVTAMLSITVAPFASAGPDCDKRPDHPTCGGDPGSGDGGVFDPQGCKDSNSRFPAAAYLFDTFKKNGRLDQTRIILTDADASCQVVVHEGDPIHFDLSFRFDPESGDGTLAWLDRSSSNWRDAVDVVRTATFSVHDAVVRTSLPLATQDVWVGTEGRHASIDVALSPNAQELAFTVTEGSINQDGFTTSELLVCDLGLTNNCNEAFFDDAFTGGPFFGGTWQAAWSSNGNGIYFLYTPDGSVFGGDLRFLERHEGGEWTLVDRAVAQNQEQIRWSEPDSVQLGEANVDCIVFSNYPADGGLHSYHVSQVPHDFDDPGSIGVQSWITTGLDLRAEVATWVERPVGTCDSGQLWISTQNNEVIKKVGLPAASSTAVETALLGGDAESTH